MYFKVTLVKKGHRFTSVHEADNKRIASAIAKKENAGAVVVKVEETTPSIETNPSLYACLVIASLEAPAAIMCAVVSLMGKTSEIISRPIYPVC